MPYVRSFVRVCLCVSQEVVLSSLDYLPLPTHRSVTQSIY